MKTFKKIIGFISLVIFLIIPISINTYAGVWDNVSDGYIDTGVGSDYDVHWGNGEDGYID